MTILYKRYTEITNMLLQTSSIFPLFLLRRFFLISGLYQIYTEKSIFLAAPEEMRMVQRREWLRKKNS